MENKKISAYHMIDTGNDLSDFARILEKEKTIAVDLEADSMYHFKERVCLVQMATDKANVVIDPLQVFDLSPLKPFFSSPYIKKVFHGADYDIRSLHRDFNIEINNLFDTELACRFLGIRHTGLNAVLQKRFNITLNKKYQKKDWSKRPLSEEMIEYAAKDVIYLVPLACYLEEELEKKGRLAWVREECEYLSKVRSISDDCEPLYMKFKGAGHLRPRNLAILEALLQLRQQLAEKKDKPAFKIFGNDVIIKIIRNRPLNLRRLENINALSRKQLRMYGNDIIRVIKNALIISEEELPVYPRKRGNALSPEIPKRVTALKLWRDAVAKSLEIDSALLCSKSLMTVIAARNPFNTKELESIHEMKRWQRESFGAEIVGVLRRTRAQK